MRRLGHAATAWRQAVAAACLMLGTAVLVGRNSSQRVFSGAERFAADRFLHTAAAVHDEALPAHAPRPAPVLLKMDQASAKEVMEEDYPGFSRDAVRGQADDRKVTVTMYMESECPACRRFSTTYLKQMLDAVGDVVDLKIVPWGNGKVTDAKQADIVFNSTALLGPLLKGMRNPGSTQPQLRFQCQHGSDECMGNAWEACLVHILPRHQDFFPIFDCIESRGCADGMSPPSCVDYPPYVAEGCLRDHGNARAQAHAPQLRACVGNIASLRERLMQNALRTLRAAPPFVPWVTVDDERLVPEYNKSDTADETAAMMKMFLLGQTVCRAFAAKTGAPEPPGCALLPTHASLMQLKAEGRDPYDLFPERNYSALAAEHAQRMMAQQMQERRTPQRQQLHRRTTEVFADQGVGATALPQPSERRPVAMSKMQMLVIATLALAVVVIVFAWASQPVSDREGGVGDTGRALLRAGDAGDVKGEGGHFGVLTWMTVGTGPPAAPEAGTTSVAGVVEDSVEGERGRWEAVDVRV